MLVELINGNYDWDLSYDVHGFWDRFLDGMAESPRDRLPRSLFSQVRKDSNIYGVNFAELLENRVELYVY